MNLKDIKEKIEILKEKKKMREKNETQEKEKQKQAIFSMNLEKSRFIAGSVRDHLAEELVGLGLSFSVKQMVDGPYVQGGPATPLDRCMLKININTTTFQYEISRETSMNVIIDKFTHDYNLHLDMYGV